jgi:hypothetical protein
VNGRMGGRRQAKGRRNLRRFPFFDLRRKKRKVA